MPRTAFPQLVNLLVTARADVMGYTSPQFQKSVDKAGCDIAVSSRLKILTEPLDSTGVQRDIEFIGDHFSVGTYFGRTGVTVFGLGCQFSAAIPSGTAALNLGLELEQADGRQGAQLAQIRVSFRRIDPDHTLEWWVWYVLAVGSGDGALANGGPKARHAGTGAMNALWKLPCPSAAAAAPLPPRP